MSTENSGSDVSKLLINFAHPLLKARDWQHRPQFDQLCQWWAEGGSGVRALIGIGGAGKTALADRFLQVIPGVMPLHPDVPKRTDLTAPQQLFVFSFYDAPNPDSFFASLLHFLSPQMAPGESNTPPRLAGCQETFATLQKAGRCLLVLDGLEKVQDDGVRGGIFGDLIDGRLNDLLVRVAEGTVPQLSVLITSRFPLSKLDELESPYYICACHTIRPKWQPLNC